MGTLARLSHSRSRPRLGGTRAAAQDNSDSDTLNTSLSPMLALRRQRPQREPGTDQTARSLIQDPSGTVRCPGRAFQGFAMGSGCMEPILHIGLPSGIKH